MGDVFYALRRPSVGKVRSALRLASRYGEVAVHMLDLERGWARQPADIGFETALALVDRSAAGYFRVADREREKNIEVFIRGISRGGKEYFIFVYLDRGRLADMVERFGLVRC